MRIRSPLPGIEKRDQLALAPVDWAGRKAGSVVRHAAVAVARVRHVLARKDRPARERGGALGVRV